MQTPVRLSRYSLVIVPVNQLRDFGNRYQQFTASAPSATPIFGQLMSWSYLVNGIMQLAKKLGKPATLNDSTVPFDGYDLNLM